MSEATSVQVGIGHRDGAVNMLIDNIEFEMSPAAARDIAQALVKHANLAGAPLDITDPAWGEVGDLQRRQLLVQRRMARAL